MHRNQRIRLWLGIVMLSLVWRVGYWHCGHPSLTISLILASCGTLLLTSCRPLDTIGLRFNRVLPVALISVCFLMVLGSAPEAAWIYAFSGCILLFSLLAGSRCGRFAQNLSISGAVLLVGGVSTIVLSQVACRLHDVGLAHLYPSILGVTQSPFGIPGDVLDIWDGERLQTVRITFEVFGLYEAWYILVGLIAISLLSGKQTLTKRLILNLAIVFAYALIRFALTVALSIELSEPDVMWDSIYVILSWLPVALLLRDLSPPRIAPLTRSSKRRCSVALLLSFFAGAALASAFGYNDPGNLKGGRVLIDETRANWEWTQEPFDTTAFGIRAEYNYYCLRQYLGHFYDVTVKSEALTPELLRNFDVLILKTLTESYDRQEIGTIVGFVEQGGGLFLIGDHTNLFGMSAHLNQVAEEFGLRFRYDDTFDLQTGYVTTFIRPRAWFHPAVRFVNVFEFLTSCSIAGSAIIEPVMIGCGLGSEDVDYSHPNFFGNMRFDLSDRFGLFLQAGAARYHGGRVLLFTDSTCFSNFCMFSPGKPELLVGFVDYLNRRDTRFPFARPVLVGTGIMSALLSLLLGRRAGRGITGKVFAVLAGMVVGSMGISYINASLYGTVDSRLGVSHALVDTAHSEASFFDYLGGLRTDEWCHFEELYITFARLGLIPKPGTVAEIEDCDPEILIIVNPCKRFAPEEIERITDYVRWGGRLFLIDSVLNSTSTANQLLTAMGMRRQVVASRARVAEASDTLLQTGNGEARHIPLVVIYGGTPLRQDDRGGTVVATSEVGSGRVLVAVDSFEYSGAILGNPLQKGNIYQNALPVFREIFVLLDHLLD
jgi:hypothetical protein